MPSHVFNGKQCQMHPANETTAESRGWGQGGDCGIMGACTPSRCWSSTGREWEGRGLEVGG